MPGLWIDWDDEWDDDPTEIPPVDFNRSLAAPPQDHTLRRPKMKQQITLSVTVVTEDEIEEPIREFMEFCNSLDDRYERSNMAISAWTVPEGPVLVSGQVPS